MQKRLVVVSAVIALALPQFALAHTSNGQSSAQDSKAFVHWQSMGRAGPEPIQSIDGNKIPGAPNGMLAEMEGPHSQTRAPTMAQSGNANQRLTFFNKQGDVQTPTHYAQISGDAALGG